jgi:ectoine hydroxylase-related dioxygenase (phytanoyl-CoA dioxygenase family)
MSQHMHSYQAGTTDNPAANLTNPTLANTSRVDVFANNKNDGIANTDDFWRGVVSTAMCATLEAGDVLFFPPGWWHGMRSETASFSVSMWF